MLLDYGFVIDRGDRGFKNFIKYTMQKVEMIIGNFECNGLERIKEQPDSYALAKTIKRLYCNFLNELNDNEKEVVKRIRYGKIKQDEYLDVYGKIYQLCYAKWERIFFKRNVYGEINKCLLGILIRSIREQQNISRAAICNATGYSYPRVRHFEMGNTLPTLDFIFKFSKMFGCSIDEMIKVASQKL